MKLLPLLCVCLVSQSGGTFAAGNVAPECPPKGQILQRPQLPVADDLIAVEEGDDVVLQCSPRTKVDISSAVFDWKKVTPQTTDQLPIEVFLYSNGKVYNKNLTGQSEQFRGRVSHFPELLKHGNASIIIRNAKVADRGNYTCEFPLLQKEKKVTIKLVVGAAPKPSITLLKQTKDWSLLKCEVLRSFPEPRVEWQDSSGNIVLAKDPQVSKTGGSYDIILETTVNKSDHYYCVATQETIYHKRCAETDIYVSGAAPDVYVAGFPTVAVVVSVLVLFF